ncbi:MAG: hypothetical protein ACK4MF_11795, partial [Hyphomicrobiaceae bacterium]
MSPRRKTISLLLALAAVAAMPADVGADRYQNQSGLRLGSFVWNPSVDDRGSVTVIVSLSERMLHVYRGGHELAIVPIGDTGAVGTTRELAFSRLRSAANDAGLWSAAPILGGSGFARAGDRPAVTVPD